MKSIISLISLCYASSLFAQLPITLKHITDDTFKQNTVESVNWMNNGQFYSALSDNQIQKYDVTTGQQVAVLLDGNALDIEINDYSFSEQRFSLKYQ